jgi:glycosyltransferase involved in cell wall biosynthesis
MDYYPNIDAVCFFAQHCWPLIRASIPSATWQIVGKNPMPDVLQLAKLPGVSVTGTVPNTKPYLTTASIAIAPLRIGSGTRLKILEAFAMQKAVVSTGLGCEGLTVEAGRHLLVADQPEAFAEAIITLLNQPEKRRELGVAGRMLVETTYSWEQCGNPLLQLLTEMEPSLHK